MALRNSRQFFIEIEAHVYERAVRCQRARLRNRILAWLSWKVPVYQATSRLRASRHARAQYCKYLETPIHFLNNKETDHGFI